MTARRKTNPDHKCRFSFGVTASCSCGWSSATWLGKGAQRSAAAEWRSHLESCERADRQAEDGLAELADICRYHGIR